MVDGGVGSDQVVCCCDEAEGEEGGDMQRHGKKTLWWLIVYPCGVHHVGVESGSKGAARREWEKVVECHCEYSSMDIHGKTSV